MMRRRLLNLFAALSLLLCAAVVALWARSFYAADQVGRCRLEESVGQTELREWTVGQTTNVIQLYIEHWTVLQPSNGAESRTLRNTYEVGRAKPFWRTGPSSDFYPDSGAAASFLERAGLSASARGWLNVGTPLYTHVVSVCVPHWLAALVTAAAPLAVGYRAP